MSISEADAFAKFREAKDQATDKKEKQKAKDGLYKLDQQRRNHTVHLTERLEQMAGLESRLTILGHLQRGGTPSGPDRILATRLGTAAAKLIADGKSGIMVAARGEDMEPVPIAEVAKTRKTVPLDHHWIRSARKLGVCLGD
jgi:6-phosphofructokinase